MLVECEVRGVGGYGTSKALCQLYMKPPVLLLVQINISVCVCVCAYACSCVRGCDL